MAYVDFQYPAGRTVRYLDVSPLIEALRFQPEDFEIDRGQLNHPPSRHRFQFDGLGQVTVEADCGCAAMRVNAQQSDELYAAFKVWRREYWTPVATNREFAAHFARPNAWVRLIRDIRMAFRRFARRQAPVGLPVDGLIEARATPAE